MALATLLLYSLYFSLYLSLYFIYVPAPKEAKKRLLNPGRERNPSSVTMR